MKFDDIKMFFNTFDLGIFIDGWGKAGKSKKLEGKEQENEKIKEENNFLYSSTSPTSFIDIDFPFKKVPKYRRIYWFLFW